jgi:Rrf2 family protein
MITKKSSYFGIGVEYALHCLVYLIGLPDGKAIKAKHLAEYQQISESYLAKTFTRLEQAGIVQSLSGPKGGYRLAKVPEQITFLEVAEAIEGKTPAFICHNIRESCVLFGDSAPAYARRGKCAIHQVMADAEQQMKTYLASKTLAWLEGTVQQKIPKRDVNKGAAWFAARVK